METEVFNPDHGEKECSAVEKKVGHGLAEERPRGERQGEEETGRQEESESGRIGETEKPKDCLSLTPCFSAVWTGHVHTQAKAKNPGMGEAESGGIGEVAAGFIPVLGGI